MDGDAREPRRRDGRRPLLRFAAMRRNLVALGIGIVLLAGCGGDDEQEPTGQDLNAVRCPMVATGKVENGVERYEPAKDAFDTAELLDEKLADAEKTAAEHGCNVVVSMKDGKGVPVTTDFDPARIYVYTENGVVTEIEGVGGGI
jgi:hypothetical protein